VVRFHYAFFNGLLDPAQQMSGKAQKRARAAGLNIELITLSAEQIPAPDATYDTVVCTFTLCTIPDPVTALWQAQRDGRAPDMDAYREALRRL
jgi:ubiquinone/menaquinone biosynthesis C-methylase UbiE